MTVYGYRKTHARLIAQGWDPGEVGSDQVMRTMRGLVWRRKPFRDLADLELATFRWVSWRNSKRLHRSLGYGIPEEVETASIMQIKRHEPSHYEGGTKIRPYHWFSIQKNELDMSDLAWR